MRQILLYFLFVLFITTGVVQGQENQLIPLNQNVYEYIKLLQQRGELLELNPTSLPYTKGEVHEAMLGVDEASLSITEKTWLTHIKKVIGFEGANQETDKKLYTHGMLSGGFSLNNTRGRAGVRADEDKPFFFPNGELQLYAEGGNFGGQLGLRHPLSYYFDNEGILPYGWYYVRAEDFYFGYQSEYLKVYYGRVKNHWGIFDEASTILSTNPYPYDNLNIRFGNNKISVEGVFGELDNLSTSGQFEETPGQSNQVNGVRRFLAMNRINWRPVPEFQLIMFRGMLYSSSTSSISLKYFNPFNELFFERTNRPNNHFNNFFVGGSIWFNKERFTMHGQLMLDDIHITNDKERITGSMVGMMNYAELFPNTDVGIEAELISYQSYNTSTQVSGRYLYMNRGIATQYNDYVMGRLYTNFHAYNWLQGLTISPQLTLLLQGEQEINQPFYQYEEDGSLPPVVLTGTIEQTVRGSLNLLYNPIPEFWVEAEVGYNSISNKDHIQSQSAEKLTGVLMAGFRLTLDGLVGN